MKKRFIDLIKHIKINSYEVIIQLHNFPDPDSIASGIMLKKIFDNYNINSIICYFGSNQKRIINKFLFQINNVPICELKDKNEIKQKILENPKSVVFCVDGNPINSNFIRLPFKYLGYIDHHKSINLKEKNSKKENIKILKKYIFSYSNIGATSTILFDLSRKLKIKLSKNILLLAALGIYTDTFGLRRNVSNKDLNIFFNIYKKLDKDKFLYFSENSFEINDIKYLKEAFENLVIKDNVAKTYVSSLEDPNLLGIIGDLFIRIVEVKIIIIFGYSEKNIFFSTRSKYKEADCFTFIRDNFGSLVSFGGHSEMAAGVFKDYKSKKYIENFINM
ncbi:MAG: DHH family phosphoesterase [Spirochaetes bacterium]|nr:DHH family phosphoesterase [Spirochaetota bacterium]